MANTSLQKLEQQRTPTSAPARLVLSTDSWISVPGVATASVTDAEAKRLAPLVGIKTEPGTGHLLIRRNRAHQVGQLNFRNRVLVVPPDIPGPLFLTFFLTALDPSYGARLHDRFIRELEAEASFTSTEWIEYFDVLLAHLYVRWTESILASHIAQTYERKQERLHLLKGKPLWNRNFGHHPAEGIECRYFQLQTDNVFNRLILAGLIKAASVLRGTQWDERVQNQLFIWHSLAKVTIPRPEMFGIAYAKLTRLNDHYAHALRLGEALLFGHAPRDLFGGGSEWLQGFYFDVPRLYENFLAFLLRQALAPYGFTVKEQFAQQGAFVDANDRRYRSVRPDIVLFKDGVPMAIIDAKYKRQYVEGWTGGYLQQRNKVSNEDLYQMFFYQARLKYSFNLSRSIPSALIAPRLPDASECPPAANRTIRWKAADTPDEHALRVLPLPLEPALEGLSRGLDPSQVLDCAPEIADFLQALIHP